jgi:hypothetical protein
MSLILNPEVSCWASQSIRGEGLLELSMLKRKQLLQLETARFHSAAVTLNLGGEMGCLIRILVCFTCLQKLSFRISKGFELEVAMVLPGTRMREERGFESQPVRLAECLHTGAS